MKPYAYLPAIGLALAAARDPLIQSRPRDRQPLVALGEASYGIYLVHGGVVVLVINTLALSWGVVALAGGAVGSLSGRG